MEHKVNCTVCNDNINLKSWLNYKFNPFKREYMCNECYQALQQAENIPFSEVTVTEENEIWEVIEREEF